MGHEYDAMRNMEARMTAQENSLRDISRDVTMMQQAMNANTDALKEYIELSKNLKVGLKFLGYMESAAVWVAKVGAALGIMWLTWKYMILEAIRQARQ